VIYAANLGLAINPSVHLVFGKFKSPVGLEMLQNDAILYLTNAHWRLTSFRCGMWASRP